MITHEPNLLQSFFRPSVIRSYDMTAHRRSALPRIRMDHEDGTISCEQRCEDHLNIKLYFRRHLSSNLWVVHRLLEVVTVSAHVSAAYQCRENGRVEQMGTKL